MPIFKSSICSGCFFETVSLPLIDSCSGFCQQELLPVSTFCHYLPAPRIRESEETILWQLLRGLVQRLMSGPCDWLLLARGLSQCQSMGGPSIKRELSWLLPSIRTQATHPVLSPSSQRRLWGSPTVAKQKVVWMGRCWVAVVVLFWHSCVMLLFEGCWVLFLLWVLFPHHQRQIGIVRCCIVFLFLNGNNGKKKKRTDGYKVSQLNYIVIRKLGILEILQKSGWKWTFV